MKQNRQLGICLDHSNAVLMEIVNGMIVSTRISSDTIQNEKVDNVDTHEIQNKEYHQLQSAYYNRLIEIIRNYKEILLFGPTDAKNELYNSIRDIPHFKSIKIDLRNTDKMTDAQNHAFVIKFFLN